MFSIFSHATDPDPIATGTITVPVTPPESADTTTAPAMPPPEACLFQFVPEFRLILPAVIHSEPLH